MTGVLQDLEKVNINMKLIEIEFMSEDMFKSICKEKIKSLAF